MLGSITKTGGQGRIGQWFSSVANRPVSLTSPKNLWEMPILQSCPDLLKFWVWGSERSVNKHFRWFWGTLGLRNIGIDKFLWMLTFQIIWEAKVLRNKDFKASSSLILSVLCHKDTSISVVYIRQCYKPQGIKSVYLESLWLYWDIVCNQQ